MGLMKAAVLAVLIGVIGCGKTPAEQGPQGEPGPEGPAGPVGPAGPQGAAGAAGPAGPAGPEGAAGPVGEAGPEGAQGLPGQPGADGVQGVAGVSVVATEEPAGENCAAGGVRYTSVDGERFVCNGVEGAQGLPGAAGAQGPQGPQGPRGLVGPAGESVTVSAVVQGDVNCPAGGSQLEVGGTVGYACNGEPAPAQAAAVTVEDNAGNLLGRLVDYDGTDVSFLRDDVIWKATIATGDYQLSTETTFYPQESCCCIPYVMPSVPRQRAFRGGFGVAAGDLWMVTNTEAFSVSVRSRKANGTCSSYWDLLNLRRVTTLGTAQDSVPGPLRLR